MGTISLSNEQKQKLFFDYAIARNRRMKFNFYFLLQKIVGVTI